MYRIHLSIPVWRYGAAVCQSVFLAFVLSCAPGIPIPDEVMEDCETQEDCGEQTVCVTADAGYSPGEWSGTCQIPCTDHSDCLVYTHYAGACCGCGGQEGICDFDYEK